MIGITLITYGMKEIICFRSDEKTAKILSAFEEKGYNKSEVIRKAIQFYNEFCFDDETWELLNRLQKTTNLRSRKAIVVAGLRVLEEVLKLRR